MVYLYGMKVLLAGDGTRKPSADGYSSSIIDKKLITAALDVFKFLSSLRERRDVLITEYGVGKSSNRMTNWDQCMFQDVNRQARSNQYPLESQSHRLAFTITIVIGANAPGYLMMQMMKLTHDALWLTSESILWCCFDSMDIANW
ncbi:hypothetical protein EYF80_046708 [Liparis tanakae]|uniref:Uncharacterized protein n=1 Tax=Liparis tanakae TaxID=230148 RepID=A0A4Z2FPP1_9TELE|nr:hypothetical protein EYF80_046708 [Liparis tanakae]